MRIFVSEFVCGGGCSDRWLHSALKREGLAMLTAACADFARLPGCRVVTTLDARLAQELNSLSSVRCAQTDGRFSNGDPQSGRPPFARDALDVIVVENAEEELRLFRQLAAECDRTFVIAPELEGVLAERRRAVDSAGGSYLGPTSAAIELCADKLRLADHLYESDIPTIDARLLCAETLDSDLPFPAVVKRRDGAGSLSMSLVPGRAQLEQVWRSHYQNSGTDTGELIVQPFVRGRDLSVATLVSEDAQRITVLPVAEQRLSRDGRFRYLGGSVPAAGVSQGPIERLVRRACAAVEGLSGYVGFDLLLPDKRPAAGGGLHGPLVVEINPRLTTSYLGYRALAADNIAERLLFPERRFPPLRWKGRPARFSPDGATNVQLGLP